MLSYKKISPIILLIGISTIVVTLSNSQSLGVVSSFFSKMVSPFENISAQRYNISDGFLSYQNPSAGIRILYPSNWEVRDEGIIMFEPKVDVLNLSNTDEQVFLTVIDHPK